MEMFELIGLLCALLIGISLGLIGSGGSILTVPVLVYLYDIPMVDAAGYAMVIVGTSTAVGSVAYFKKGLVRFRVLLTFGFASVIAVFASRKFLLPMLPETILSLPGWTLDKNSALLLLFAVLMFLASFSMIRHQEKNIAITTPGPQTAGLNTDAIRLFLEGILVGSLTGLVGIGGGFLIIPALVNRAGLQMKEAVGTSLVIITLNAISGLTGLSVDENFQGSLIMLLTALSILGIFIGMFISRKIQGEKLKPIFGWFVLAMGIYILVRELFFDSIL